jgi:hypothetical protein
VVPLPVTVTVPHVNKEKGREVVPAQVPARVQSNKTGNKSAITSSVYFKNFAINKDQFLHRNI